MKLNVPFLLHDILSTISGEEKIFIILQLLVGRRGLS